MKQITIILLAFLTFEAAGQKINYGNWSNASQCFQGLGFRSAYGNYNTNGKWMLHFEFNNKYNTTIHFNYKINDLEGNYVTGGRMKAKAKQILTGAKDGCWGLIAQNKGEINIRITDVRFGDDDHSPVCNKSNTLYADCDTRPGVPNWPPECNEQKTQGNSNTTKGNPSGSNQQNQTSGRQTNAEIDNINQYLTKIGDSDTEKQRIVRELDVITGSTTLTDSQKAARIKTLTGQAKTRAEQLDRQDTARKAEEERQQKAQEERDKIMRSHVEKGDGAFTSGEYANAKIHYSNALGFATSEEQKQQIQAAIAKAQQAIEAEQRKKRIGDRQAEEKKNNVAAGAALAGTFAIMTLLEDEYSDNPVAGRYYIGVGMSQHLFNVNDAQHAQSKIQFVWPVSGAIGLEFTFFNDKRFNWVVNPEFAYYYTLGSAGTISGGIGLLGKSSVNFSFDSNRSFNIFAEGHAGSRSLSYSYDTDVANGGNSATDKLYEGSLKYKYYRFGGGLFYRSETSDGGEFLIKPGYFIEKSKSPGVPRNVFNLQLNLKSKFYIDLSYSSKYISFGKVDYPQSAEWIETVSNPATQSYWELKITRRGLFGN